MCGLKTDQPFNPQYEKVARSAACPLGRATAFLEAVTIRFIDQPVLHLDGESFIGGPTACQVINCQVVIISRTAFLNAEVGYGLEIRDCESVLLDRNLFKGNAMDGLKIYGKTAGLITNCLAIRNGSENHPQHGDTGDGIDCSAIDGPLTIADTMCLWNVANGITFKKIKRPPFSDARDSDLRLDNVECLLNGYHGLNLRGGTHDVDILGGRYNKNGQVSKKGRGLHINSPYTRVLDAQALHNADVDIHLGPQTAGFEMENTRYGKMRPARES